MPIPPFDLNGVLPPHLGNPTDQTQVSPYRTDTVELCQQFGTTPERVAILQGFMKIRAAFTQAGIVNGFQLIDGSFLEEVEKNQGRPPNDIDVASFCWSVDPRSLQVLTQLIPEISDLAKLKQTYHVDHYLLDVGFHPQLTVEVSQYWYGLFSHTRSRLWKGMVRVELNTPNEDANASLFLGQRAAPVLVTP